MVVVVEMMIHSSAGLRITPGRHLATAMGMVAQRLIVATVGMQLHTWPWTPWLTGFTRQQLKHSLKCEWKANRFSCRHLDAAARSNWDSTIVQTLPKCMGQRWWQ